MSDYLSRLQPLCPRTPAELHRLIRRLLGLRVPRRPLIPGNSAPFDYLQHAFFENRQPRDLVVWANRGGGKTMLGAVATLLDLLFKPGIQIRILGGSFEQSSKMFLYLRQLLDTPHLRPVLADTPTRKRIELTSGSAVELLAQSQRSVRGHRVHKLRCDEVEEFDPDIWTAAQMITRTGRCGPFLVRGCVEALSTLHRPFGLMSRLVAPSPPLPIPGVGEGRGEGSFESLGSAASSGPSFLPSSPVSCSPSSLLFRWSALDVLEPCPPSRPCPDCPLHPECQGRAKNAEGFLPIDDLLAQRSRCSQQAWESELLCRQPRRSDSVYPNFDPQRHVTPNLPPASAQPLLLAGCDFGMRSPLSWLWALAWRESDQTFLHVLDEYSVPERTLDAHLDHIESRPHPRPAWVAVDPAGQACNDQTGQSNVQRLRARGHRVRHRASRLADGIETIRARFDHHQLRIHPRCQLLIQALTQYHFDPENPHRQDPIKDGPDHLCDALRYLVVNLDSPSSQVIAHRYA